MFSPRSDGLSCGFIGTSDIYGLGIRIGFYTQTFSAWIGCEFIRHDPAELMVASSLFMSAVLISLLWLSIKNELYAVEAFLLLQMLFISWFTSPAYRFRTRLLSYTRRIEGELLNRILKALILLYNFWFWWYGLDRLAPTSCGTYGFFVAYKFELYGVIRTVHKVLSIVALLVETRRAYLYVLGTITIIRARKLYSVDFHELIQREARARAESFGIHEWKNLTHVVASDLSGSLELSSEDPAKGRRRWSFSNIREKTSHHSCNNNGSRGSSQPLYQPGPLVSGIYAADVFLEDILREFLTKRDSLSRRTFKVGPFQADTLSFIELHKCYWRVICGLARTLITEPSQLQSITIIFLTYTIECTERRTHDLAILLDAVLQDSRLHELKWTNLHIAAQLHAGNATQPRSAGFICWNAAVGLFFCIIQVLAIELTIVWNNITEIDDLSSVGQLIPFIIGCGSLIRVCYVEAKRYRRYGSLFSKATAEEKIQPCPSADAYFAWKAWHERLRAPSGK